jgi:CO/xanthine dehydrogenase Mo-binding subunit
MNEIRSVGIPSPRVEGEQKVGGGAVYAVDVVLPDMLWAKVLRSPIAHGRIKKIDMARSLAAPGVRAAIIGAEMSGARIGEKVAAVAADSEAIAEAALDLIEVEYEELPIVTDALAAIAPDASLLHPSLADYKGLLHKIEKPSNVFVDLRWKKGEVQEGFRQSDVVVENTFTVPAVHQAYIEPHSSVVRVNSDGTADIWSSNKSPFGMRDQVGNALQVAPT